MSRGLDEEYQERVRAYRRTEPYRKALRKRAVWVEPLFGEAKEWHGSGRFRLRGLEKVNAEALMTASGQNVKRLVSFGPRGPKKLATAAALQPPEEPSPRRTADIAHPGVAFFNRLVRSPKSAYRISHGSTPKCHSGAVLASRARSARYHMLWYRINMHNLAWDLRRHRARENPIARGFLPS